ncbi:MAG: hypothetical protein PUC88_07350 [Clostridia bacterium]|nr:hypothetical protein [Clostridia bacterium]
MIGCLSGDEKIILSISWCEIPADEVGSREKESKQRKSAFVG